MEEGRFSRFCVASADRRSKDVSRKRLSSLEVLLQTHFAR